MTTGLANYKQQVDRALAKFFRTQINAETNSANKVMLQDIHQLIVRGGKRLRPTLVMIGYYGFNGNSDKILKAAVSQELLHTFLLIHDDIIDNDIERHAGPNIAGAYLSRYYQNKVSSLSEANNFALLAGDLCRNLADKALAEAGFRPQLTLLCLDLMRQAVQKVIGGQLQEIKLGLQTSSSVPVKQILDIYAHKTASYSFSLPLQIGAILAGAKAKDWQQIPEFSEPLGIAFQIRDDLDEIAETDFKDLGQGNQNLIINQGLRRLKGSDRDKLITYFGNRSLKPGQIQAVKQLLVNCGAQAYAKQLLERQLQIAAEHLKNSPLNESGKAQLIELASALSLLP